MKAVDRIIEKLPEYANMRGIVSDDAIIAHASAVYPTTTAIALTEAEVESEGFGLFGLGDIFKAATTAVKGVIGAGKGVIQAFSKTHKIQITPKEPQPTAAQIAAAAKPDTKPSKSPSWILPAVIAIVVAVVVVLVVTLTGKAK